MRLPKQPIDWSAVAHASGLRVARLEDAWAMVLTLTKHPGMPLTSMHIESGKDGSERVRFRPRRLLKLLTPEERVAVDFHRRELREVARAIAAELAREDEREDAERVARRQRRTHAAQPTPQIRVLGIVVDESDVKDALDTLGDGVYEAYVAGIGFSKDKAYDIATRRLRQVLGMNGPECLIRMLRHEREQEQLKSRKDTSRGTSQGFSQ